jgi:hypothetical protein
MLCYDATIHAPFSLAIEWLNPKSKESADGDWLLGADKAPEIAATAKVASMREEVKGLKRHSPHSSLSSPLTLPHLLPTMPKLTVLLEKDTFVGGDVIRGTLTLTTQKPLNSREIYVKVKGVEISKYVANERVRLQRSVNQCLRATHRWTEQRGRSTVLIVNRYTRMSIKQSIDHTSKQASNRLTFG